MQVDILEVWKGKQSTRVPVWLMRQAGRYLPEYRQVRASVGGFLDLVYNPALAAEVTLQPVRRFDVDAAILFSDILVVPHALGLKVEFPEGEGPRLQTVHDTKDLLKLDMAGAPAIWAPVCETIGRVRTGLPEGKALIGFCGSPWTVASYMVHGEGGHDFARIKAWAIHDSAGFSKLIDVLVEASIAYLDAQIRAGAQAIQIFESWANVLTGALFDRWVIGPNARIAAGIRALHPSVPLIGFPRTVNEGDVAHFAEKAGFDALSIGENIAPSWAAQTIQKTMCVQGNLAPSVLLNGGDTMRRAALSICHELAGGAFVFNLGHGIIKETDPAHVAELVKLVHDFKEESAKS